MNLATQPKKIKADSCETIELEATTKPEQNHKTIQAY